MCETWCNPRRAMIKLAIEAIVFGFITKAEWPPSSPDTYPLYYCFLAVTENESSTQHHNIEVLNAKYRIKFPWKLCRHQYLSQKISICDFLGLFSRLILFADIINFSGVISFFFFNGTYAVLCTFIWALSIFTLM